MAGNIGKDFIGGSFTNLTSGANALKDPTFLYVGVAGDVVDQFFFYGHDAFVPGANLDIAVYDVIAGVPVNRINVPVNIVAASSTNQWWGSAAGLGIPLVAGTLYCVAIVQVSACRIAFDQNVNGRSHDASLVLPVGWVESSQDTIEFSIYAKVIAGVVPPVGVVGSSGDDFDLLNY